MEDRLLTPEKILAIKADVKASDFNSLKEFAEGLDQVIVSAQDIKSRADIISCIEQGLNIELEPLVKEQLIKSGTFKAEDKRGNR